MPYAELTTVHCTVGQWAARVGGYRCSCQYLQWSLQSSHDTPAGERNSVLFLQTCSGVCSCLTTRTLLNYDSPAGENSSVLSLQEPAVDSVAAAQHTCRREILFCSCKTCSGVCSCLTTRGKNSVMFLQTCSGVCSCLTTQHTCRREEFCYVPANLQWSVQMSHDTTHLPERRILLCSCKPAVWSLQRSHNTTAGEKNSVMFLQTCSGVCSCLPTRHTCRREEFCYVPANLQWSLQRSHNTTAGEKNSVMFLQTCSGVCRGLTTHLPERRILLCSCKPAVEFAAVSRHT